MKKRLALQISTFSENPRGDVHRIRNRREHEFGERVEGNHNVGHMVKITSLSRLRHVCQPGLASYLLIRALGSKSWSPFRRPPEAAAMIIKPVPPQPRPTMGERDLLGIYLWSRSKSQGFTYRSLWIRKGASK